MESVTIYQKIMSRTMVLIDCEIWDTGERIRLPQILNGAYFFNPLFSHKEGTGIDVYYNFSDPAQDSKHLINYLVEHLDWLAETKKEFDKNCERIRILTKEGQKENFQELYDLIIEVWPLIAIISTIISNENVYPIGQNLISLAYTIRKESDGVLHWGTEKIITLSSDLVPAEYKKWVEYLRHDEIINNNNNFPSEEELEKRKESYVFHNGELYLGQTLDQYAKKENFEIKGYIGEQALSPQSLIRGATAFPGKVQGKVTLVFERSDIDKVQAGDILVTAMTTPNLISAMNKAAAFVTDEGGITCHAAIVAREIKKPCIIGTKIATQVLKDGDMVEVDADNGVVRVLENK